MIRFEVTDGEGDQNHIIIGNEWQLGIKQTKKPNKRHRRNTSHSDSSGEEKPNAKIRRPDKKRRTLMPPMWVSFIEKCIKEETETEIWERFDTACWPAETNACLLLRNRPWMARRRPKIREVEEDSETNRSLGKYNNW